MNGARTPGRTVRIGTRGSKLALIQVDLVHSAFAARWPEMDVRPEIISTTGDIVQDRPLSLVGGNGVFVRRIEQALLDGAVDAAAHSAKDLPSTLAPGTVIAAYLPREDPRDVLASNDGSTLASLPSGARVGTSSPRRACQLRALRPDLRLLDIRGNVDTRLRKLREGQYDAIVLAAAGLQRLGRISEVTEWLETSVVVPAVGQGAIAVQVREDDVAMLDLMRLLDDPSTSAAITAERSFLATVGGSCTLPVGAHAVISADVLAIQGMIGTVDGRMVRGELRGQSADSRALGKALAEELLRRGGDSMIAEDLAGQAQP